MLVIAFIVMLASLVPTCDSVQCLQGDTVYLSSSELIVEHLEEALKNLSTEELAICQVSMKFDFHSRSFTMEFQAAMAFRRRRSAENSYAYISTSIGLDHAEQNPNQTSLKTEIDLGCYSDDACDRALIFVYFQWMISADYTELESAVHPWILLADIKKNECSIGTAMEVEPCNGKLCYWEYSTAGKQSNGQCIFSSTSRVPMVTLKTDVKMYQASQQEVGDGESTPDPELVSVSLSIRYWCDLNNCNNPQSTTIIREAAFEHYDVWAMYKDLVKPNKGDLSNEQSPTPMLDSTTTPNQTPSTTTTSSIPVINTSNISQTTDTTITSASMSKIMEISDAISTMSATSQTSPHTAANNETHNGSHISCVSVTVALFSVFLLWESLHSAR